MKRIAALDEALGNYKSFEELDKNRVPEGNELDLHWSQRGLEKKQAWSKASFDFGETRLFVDVLCSKELKVALDDLGVYTNLYAVEMVKGKIPTGINAQIELHGR